MRVCDLLLFLRTQRFGDATDMGFGRVFASVELNQVIDNMLLQPEKTYINNHVARLVFNPNTKKKQSNGSLSFLFQSEKRKAEIRVHYIHIGRDDSGVELHAVSDRRNRQSIERRKRPPRQHQGNMKTFLEKEKKKAEHSALFLS